MNFFVESNIKEYNCLGSNHVVITSYKQGAGFNVERFRLRAEQPGDKRFGVLCERVRSSLIII